MKVEIEVDDKYKPYMKIISVSSGKNETEIATDIVEMYFQGMKSEIDKKIKDEINKGNIKKGE